MQKCDGCHKPAWACAGCLADIETPKTTHADQMLMDLQNVECLCELLWDGHDERVPDFDTKQDLLDWLRQPAEE